MGWEYIFCFTKLSKVSKKSFLLTNNILLTYIRHWQVVTDNCFLYNVRVRLPSMNTALKIILVDKNTGRSAMLRRALQDKGHEVICRMDSSANLRESNEMTHADVVIVNSDIPDDEVFANLTEVNKTKPKPIVMFTEESNSEMTSSAIKSGVNAYIVDGLEENRVQPIIDVAMARFREFQALKDELDATRNQLSERKTVEKAKGILMKHKNISEDDAYQSLRKVAMDKNKRIVDVSESVINAFELLD